MSKPFFVVCTDSTYSMTWHTDFDLHTDAMEFSRANSDARTTCSVYERRPGLDPKHWPDPDGK